MSNFLRGLASEKEQLNAALLRIKELEQEVIDEEKFSEESHELLKEAWDQRDEARAEVKTLSGEALACDRRRLELEADNAKLRVEAEDYKRGMLSDRARLALSETLANDACVVAECGECVGTFFSKAMQRMRDSAKAWREGKT